VSLSNKASQALAPIAYLLFQEESCPTYWRSNYVTTEVIAGRAEVRAGLKNLNRTISGVSA